MASLLTVAEFRSAPTATNTNDLAYGQNQLANDAELATNIRRATAWLENQANQPLVAGLRTKTFYAPVMPDGTLWVHPGENPLISLSSLSVGTNGGDLVATSTTKSWLDVDADAFGVPSSLPQGRALVRASFVSGFVSTTLAATINQGATSLTLASGVGVVAGSPLTIVDGQNTEEVVAASVVGNIVTLSGGVTFTHTFLNTVAGTIAVHSCPEDLRQAAIWVTIGMTRTRGNDAMVAGQMLSAGSSIDADPNQAISFRMATRLLYSYRRIR
jgi:hypothetical protein